MSAASLSIIIVSRGLESLLSLCLTHLRAALRELPGSEIVIVDNASATPYSASRYRRDGEILIRCDTHQDFGRACNVGARVVKSTHLCFLNNDVLLDPVAISLMMNASIAGKAEVCGARMTFPDETIQHCGVVFGEGEVGPYHVHRKLHSQIVSRVDRYFQAVTGACLMIDSALFRSLGGFDEGYGFGLEDIDLCLRARQAGARCMVSSGVDSLHFESFTPGRVELDRSSRKRFMAQWSGRYTIDG